MSCLPHDNIWKQWFGNKKQALCPVCENFTMSSGNKSKHNWYRGHIFQVRENIPWGQDIYPNIAPICFNCHNGISNKMNMFEYMVSIGKLTEFQAEECINNTISKIKNFNTKCEFPNCKAFRGTPAKKIGMDTKYCSRHDGIPIPMDTT